MSEWARAYEVRSETIGQALIPLVLQPDDWILRRVEEVAIRSRTAVRRSVSLDLVLPRDPAPLLVDPSDPRPVLVVPLGLMDKRQLVDFDLQEGDTRLSLVRSDLNSWAAAGILWNLAVFDGIAPTSATAAMPWFRRISGFSREDAVYAFDALMEGGADPGPQAREVSRSPRVRAMAAQLRDAYIMLVEMAPDGGRRRLVRFATDQPIDGPAASLPERLGFVPTHITLDAPGASQAASYHLEVVVPPGCVVSAVDGSAEAASEGELTLFGPRAARYVPSSAAEPGFMDISVAGEPNFFFRPAMMLSWIVAVVLAAGLITTVSGGAFDAAAAAIMLSGLSAITGLVIRSDDDRLTVELHGAARFVLAGVGIVAFGAAATVAFGATGTDLERWWLGWLAGAVLGAVILTAGFVQSRRAARKRSG